MTCPRCFKRLSDSERLGGMCCACGVVLPSALLDGTPEPVQ